MSCSWNWSNFFWSPLVIFILQIHHNFFTNDAIATAKNDSDNNGNYAIFEDAIKNDTSSLPAFFFPRIHHDVNTNNTTAKVKNNDDNTMACDDAINKKPSRTKISPSFFFWICHNDNTDDVIATINDEDSNDTTTGNNDDDNAGNATKNAIKNDIANNNRSSWNANNNSNFHVKYCKVVFHDVTIDNDTANDNDGYDHKDALKKDNS